MHRRAGITLPETLVIVGVVALLVMFLVPYVDSSARELPNPIVCMSNLNGIHKALLIYKSDNNDAWPWIANATGEWADVPVGTDRNRDPFKDPNDAGERSMTSLMFLLVRMNQTAGMFRCPSDNMARLDDRTRTGADDGDVFEAEYYWDFSRPKNVSYSWQAPVWKDGKYAQGLDDAEPDAVVVADMTPNAVVPGWTPADVSKLGSRAIVNQNSPNHSGKRNNVLTVSGCVQPRKRPDVGVDGDNIYTASGDPNAGSQSATSLDIRKHLSPADTFLIGPVGRKAK